ncbi:MAG: pyruvate kinase, partial [Halobacteriaceae archaeon]
RLNASHGTRSERAEMIDITRDVDKSLDKTVAVMLDIPGPEIRTVGIDETRSLNEGDEIWFVQGPSDTSDEIGLSVDISAVSAGDTILLDDGRIETTALNVNNSAVRARIENTGTIEGRVGVNIPGVDLGIDIVTEQDKRELELAADKNVDFIAASFVRSKEDVLTISEIIENLSGDIPIIAKIERANAVNNLEGIIDAADGIMVARGDLGVEWPLEQVPIIQKRIIHQCHEAGVPVITATEMLDSMIHERRPTRAEATDVANAVLDGTDAVMLSGETAVGDHPIKVVETMADIIHDVEQSDEYAENREDHVPASDGTQTGALARSARYLAQDVGATAIIAVTESGYTARKAAKYRPATPIVASTPNHEVRRQLALIWGVYPTHTPLGDDVESIILDAVQSAVDSGVAESGDTLVAMAGMMTELEGVKTTNTLKVHVAAEVLASGQSVVPGYASGPIYTTTDGDITDFPDGGILVVPSGFEAELTGELDQIAGIVDARPGQTSYVAMVARELEVPMISNATLNMPEGTPVRLDAERGVIYGKTETSDIKD